MELAKTSEANGQLFEAVARIASTLGSPTRLKILYILSQAPRSVDVVAEMIGESVANTSQHLQRLLHERLLCVKKEKLSRIYSISNREVALLIENLFDVAERISPVLGLAESEAAHCEYGPLVWLDSVLDDLRHQKAVLIDVREAYEVEHSPVEGALSLPLDTLKQNLKSLSKNKTYYLFCRGRACSIASEGVKILRSHGFNAFRLKDHPISIQVNNEK